MTDDLKGRCVCGCDGDEKRCTGLDLGAVRLNFDFTISEATCLKLMIETGLYALREKRLRLAAMEPSWTIGPEDLRILREVTERQLEEGYALVKRILIHPASDLFNPPNNLN